MIKYSVTKGGKLSLVAVLHHERRFSVQACACTCLLVGFAVSGLFCFEIDSVDGVQIHLKTEILIKVEK